MPPAHAWPAPLKAWVAKCFSLCTTSLERTSMQKQAEDRADPNPNPNPNLNPKQVKDKAEEAWLGLGLGPNPNPNPEQVKDKVEEAWLG